MIEDTIGTDLIDACFSYFQAVVLNSLTFQGKHNIYTLSIYYSSFQISSYCSGYSCYFLYVSHKLSIRHFAFKEYCHFYTVFIDNFSHCSDCSCNCSFLLFFTGPPVITNNTVILLEDDKGCLLNVMFYSFNSNVKMTWYKNGRRLISSEHMKQSFTSHKHLVEMHGILVPIDAKTATLRINLVCDLDESIYSFTAHDVLHRTSYIFEKDGKLIMKFQCSFRHML